MNNITTFYIIRHGETEWNVERRVQGHGDSPLTKNGILQAKGLAKKLKDIKFDLAFSSDLLRAKRTAEIIALEHNLAVQTSELLRERMFGKHEGKNGEALKTYYELLDQMNEADRYKFTMDGIESDELLTSRFLNFIRETAITHPGKKVLLITHGGTLRSLLIHTGTLTYKPFVPIANTAYVIIETDGSDFFVKETKGIGN